MRRQILLIAALFLFAVGATGFQQGQPLGSHQPYTERQAQMLSLIRTINTIEVTESSYMNWHALQERHGADLNDWLARTGVQGAQLRFGELPEILPGLKLRLNLNADGRGYSVLIEDIQDKHGFAFVSDERGIIREGKYIR